jgi:hypothetical protein
MKFFPCAGRADAEAGVVWPVDWALPQPFSNFPVERIASALWYPVKRMLAARHAGNPDGGKNPPIEGKIVECSKFLMYSIPCHIDLL